MMMLVEWKYLMQPKCSQSLDGPLLYIIQIFDIKHFKNTTKLYKYNDHLLYYTST